MSSDGDHDWTVRQLPGFALGLLEPDHTARVETHLRCCETCRDNLAVLRFAPSMRHSAAGHVPQEAFEKWPATLQRLQGATRAMVRRHLEECESCRVLARTFGGSDRVPVVPEIEDPQELNRMGGTLSRSLADRMRTKRTWRNFLPTYSLMATACALLLVMMTVRERDARFVAEAGVAATVKPRSTRSGDAETITGPVRSLNILLNLPPDLTMNSPLTVRLIGPSNDVIEEIRGTWQSLHSRSLVVLSKNPLPEGSYRVEYQSEELPDPVTQYFRLIS